MNTNNTSVNIDDLLDGTLDDLADMPSFKPFPKGAHKLKLGWTVKQIGEMPAVELKLTLVEVVELAGEVAEADMPKPGDETSVAYILKKKNKENGSIENNELAQGQMKAVIQSLKQGTPELATKTNREVMEATEGLEVLGVTDVRIDKRESKTDSSTWKYYTDLKSVAVI